MLSSRIAAAAFGALALTVGAFTVAPAMAAPIAAAGTVQTAPAGDLVQQAQYYGPRRHYRGRPYYGRPVYRQRCFVTNRRVWTGRGWIIRPTRVCR